LQPGTDKILGTMKYWRLYMSSDSFLQFMEAKRREFGFRDEWHVYTNDLALIQGHIWNHSAPQVQMLRWATFGFVPDWIQPFIPEDDLKFVIVGDKEEERVIGALLYL